MTCRANIFFVKFVVILVLAVSFMPSILSAESVNNETVLAASDPVSWARYQSENWTISNDSSGQGLVYSTYPLWLQTIYSWLLSWEPRVKITEENQARCRLSFSSENLADKVSDVSQFIKQKPECVYLQSSKNSSKLFRIMNSLSIDFDMSDTKHFRKITFNIPDQNGNQKVHIRGLLAIHDDKKPRPLVIFRMGVHGNIDEFLAERFLAKLIYEDFNFNFLALENLTSHGYLAQDNPITFGGVDEGLHTFYILNQLQESALKNIISETHLLGVSLGAHGIFFTEALDEINRHLIKSVTAFCPVINLVETLSNQQEAKMNFGLIDLWNGRRLQAVTRRLPELEIQDRWKTLIDFKPRFVPAVLKYLETHQIRPSVQMPIGTRWPPGLENHLLNAKSFSELNNFWQFYLNNKTPILIVTTPQDVLVSEKLNTDLILQKKQPGQFNKTQILQLDRGIHCGLGSDYQWSFIIDLLKTQWGKPHQ